MRIEYLRRCFFTVFYCFLVSVYGQTKTENYILNIIPSEAMNVSEMNELLSIDNLSLELDSPATESVYIARENIVLKEGFTSSAETNGDVNFLIDDRLSQNTLQSVTYLDDLGRTKQTIAIGQATGGGDIVQFIEYDSYGRLAKSYLPFSMDNNNGALLTNQTALSLQQDYYDDNYGDLRAYAELRFDETPLSRILERTKVGEDFILDKSGDNDNTQKIGYYVNNDADNVYMFSVHSNNTLLCNGKYSANELKKTIARSEDWKPEKGNLYTNEIFTDKEGREVAQKSYQLSEDGSVESVWSYNVFSDIGQLLYTLPSKFIHENKEVLSLDEPIGFQYLENFEYVDELTYQYRYDEYNRVIAQKGPEREWEYKVYDNLDRVVLVQDPSLNELEQWMFVKYDVYNRPIYTGLYDSADNRADLQLEIDNFLKTGANYEEVITTSSTVTIGSTSLSYTNNVFPNNNIEVLTVNYYDDYNFIDSDKPTKPTSVEGQTVTLKTNSLLTANWTKTIGDNSWTKTYNYYDEEASVIKSKTVNRGGGYTDTELKLDFNKNILKSITKHTYKNNSGELVVEDRYEYDRLKRPIAKYKTINNQPEVHISSVEYDDLGGVVTKNIGGEIHNPLQTEDYTYSINGLLTKVNDVNNIGSDLFAYDLVRNEKGMLVNSQGSNIETPAYYNGNINQFTWLSKLDNLKRSYIYNYDSTNQLSSATYGEGSGLVIPNGKAKTLSDLKYDFNGNITSLKRHGLGNSILDNLTYNYSSGNKLLSVTDSGDKSNGFVDGNTQGDDYEYNDNGALIKDENKGISNIVYNHLDRIERIEFESGTTIEFIYNAKGVKLEKKYTSSNGVEVITEYVGAFQYQNDQLLFFPTAEGYAYKDEFSSYKYAYNVSDYLGNNRLTYVDHNEDGVIQTSELISSTDYYPYGMMHMGNHESDVANNFKYKYQNKEYQQEGGLNLLDFGSRMYDAALGRWSNTDPQNQFGSPYLAMGNNPLSYVDPDGEVLITLTVILVTIAVAGTINVIANLDRTDNVWQGVGFFLTGGAVGVASLYVPGAAPLFAGAGSAIDEFIAGGNGEDAAIAGVTGIATTFVGGKLTKHVTGKISNTVVGKLKIANKLLENTIKNSVSGFGTGYLLSGTIGHFRGENFNDAGLKGGFRSAGSSAVTSFSTGVAASYSKGINPFTQKIIKPAKVNTEIEGLVKKKPYSKSRPGYAKDQVEQVWETAKKQSDGKVYDPNTGDEITWDKSKSRNGQWDMGHTKGNEYKKLHQSYMSGSISKDAFLKIYRDPAQYQPELVGPNRSRKHEAK